MATIFGYVDESGQDTIGLFFVVSILIVGTERDELNHLLERIEKESGKGILKWRKTSIKKREIYIQLLIKTSFFVHTLFYETFTDSKEYLDMTATAAGDALRVYGADDKAIVFVDGLRESAVPKFKRQLKPSVDISVKVRGVRKDENNAFIRLADAVCGLVRDAYANQDWAVKTLRLLKKKGLVTKL